MLRADVPSLAPLGAPERLCLLCSVFEVGQGDWDHGPALPGRALDRAVDVLLNPPHPPPRGFSSPPSHSPRIQTTSAGS
eukprot:353781-Chlamydomonas_euryale.AAC.2